MFDSYHSCIWRNKKKSIFVTFSLKFQKLLKDSKDVRFSFYYNLIFVRFYYVPLEYPLLIWSEEKILLTTSDLRWFYQARVVKFLLTKSSNKSSDVPYYAITFGLKHVSLIFITIHWLIRNKNWLAIWSNRIIRLNVWLRC